MAAAQIRQHYDNGMNDKCILIQLGHSLARVGLGFFLACIVAIPLGFAIGMSPMFGQALDPFIQVLKLRLTAEEQKWLQVVPYKDSLPTLVPTDPLIYRWYEIVSVYGTTIKELIHKEFGDGIMSAIDFSMDIVRQPDPKGDRVNVVLSGKFLPYRQY